MNLKIKNPILIGVCSAILIYCILYIENRRKEKDPSIQNQVLQNGSISLKLPIIVGLMMWGASYLYKSTAILCPSKPVTTSSPVAMSKSMNIFDQDIFTEQPDF